MHAVVELNLQGFREVVEVFEFEDFFDFRPVGQKIGVAGLRRQVLPGMPAGLRGDRGGKSAPASGFSSPPMSS